MLKKILIGLAVLIGIVIAALVYLNYRNRTASPAGEAKLTSSGLTVTIPYSRPSVRGRVIFGTKEQGALQSYGLYWRLGANESTEITFSQDVNFNGTPVKAGTYRTYAIPGADAFEFVLNSELGKWGVPEPDYSLDVYKTKVPIEKLSTPIELYTIRLESIDNGVNAIFEWEKVRLVVPITKAN